MTFYWTILYNSCILLISSFCDSSHIVTTRSFLFRVSTKATQCPPICSKSSDSRTIFTASLEMFRLLLLAKIEV